MQNLKSSFVVRGRALVERLINMVTRDGEKGQRSLDVEE